MQGYRKERDRLAKLFGTSKSEAMRLIRTESQRVNVSTQQETAKANGFTHYHYVAESGACDVCKPLGGKTFKIEDFEIGVSASPIHPNCRCSHYYEIEMEYKAGGSTMDGVEITKKTDILPD